MEDMTMCTHGSGWCRVLCEPRGQCHPHFSDMEVEVWRGPGRTVGRMDRTGRWVSCASCQREGLGSPGPVVGRALGLAFHSCCHHAHLTDGKREAGGVLGPQSERGVPVCGEPSPSALEMRP